MLHHHRPMERAGAEQSELERKVEVADGLLRETLVRLSHRSLPDLLEASARDDLMDLKPHLEEALASLEDIEGRRSLTDEELSRRRAFKMFLTATLLL
jgi:hypothetical protein